MDIQSYLTIIGTNIKSIRGLTKQQDLAKKAGVSRSTLSNIENAKSIELDNLLKIASALGIEPANLFLTDEDQKITYKAKLFWESLLELKKDSDKK